MNNKTQNYCPIDPNMYITETKEKYVWPVIDDDINFTMLNKICIFYINLKSKK